jgi:hypothetical protein
MFRWGNRLNNVIAFHDHKSSDLFALGKSKVSSLTDLLPIMSIKEQGRLTYLSPEREKNRSTHCFC